MHVEPGGEAKSLSSEITLDRDLSKFSELRPILWRLCETVARRMKKAGVAGEGVALKLKTADFRIVTRNVRLQRSTQSAEDLFNAAEPLLARQTDGRAFRLIGVGAQRLAAAKETVQEDLFGDTGSGDRMIETVVDAVRQRFGDGAIDLGRGFGIELKRQGPSKLE